MIRGSLAFREAMSFFNPVPLRIRKPRFAGRSNRICHTDEVPVFTDDLINPIVVTFKDSEILEVSLREV